MSDKTIEPVFPTIHNGSTLPGERGMPLRDWFAGMAMQAQKQKPLAWMCTETKVLYEHDTSLVDKYYGFKPTVPLYAHPPTSILDELMEAVKPLANLDLQAGQLEKYDDSLTVYQRDNSKITIGDIRKARLVLEAAKEQGL